MTSTLEKTRGQLDLELSAILFGEDLELYFRILWDHFRKRTNDTLRNVEMTRLIELVRKGYAQALNKRTVGA